MDHVLISTWDTNMQRTPKSNFACVSTTELLTEDEILHKHKMLNIKQNTYVLYTRLLETKHEL